MQLPWKKASKSQQKKKKRKVAINVSTDMYFNHVCPIVFKSLKVILDGYTK